SDTNSQYISIGSTENEFSNNITNVENLFQTGSLGALLKFRREELNNARNTVGQLALNFSDSMNSFHTLGYDQYGQ
ncbi:flagellar hook protein, partial [Buchnera aphidicola]|nr:flagellar hook protein [Buchnera aphidicola]